MRAPPTRSAAPVRPVRTLFLGSGAFALPVLHALLGHRAVAVVGVVTPPDRPAGRHGVLTAVPAAVEARRLELALLQPERLRAPDAVAAVGDLSPELGILADYGWIVPSSILDVAAHGFLNVHPSILPRHRGATPIPATILAGDKVAGVSVIRMDAGLDTGPIVGTRTWPLTGAETAPELEARAAREGAELLGDLLRPYLHGARPPIPQDEAAATLTRPLRRQDGRLDPERPAQLLERQVRAFLPWPGSYLDGPAGRLAVLRADVGSRRDGDQVGTLVADGAGLALVTTDGRLRLLDVQPAGGRPMPAAAFRRGHPTALGPLASGVT